MTKSQGSESKTDEQKLKEIVSRVSQEDSLHIIPKEESERFEKHSEREGAGTVAIMTYGDHVVYLKADDDLPDISLSKFNYTSGTFQKKWGEDHRSIVLTPNHSVIRKVTIQIQGMDINDMRLLPDKKGDVIEDTANIKITRHYRFAKGDEENKRDKDLASPGEREAEKQ